MSKIDWSNTDRLKTRDGRRVLGSVQLETENKRLVVVMDHDETEDSYPVDATNGSADDYAGCKDADDIVMRPKTITRYATMYKGCSPFSVIWDTYEEADRFFKERDTVDQMPYTIIPIEIEIPEGWE